MASDGTAPTYGLVQDAAIVVEALPSELFDRHAEHRPCGLLCQRGAMGMLIGDSLGLPLMPWVLAEPVGKAALKHRDAIANEKKRIVDAKDDEGVTALMKVAAVGSLDVFKLLLDQKASPDAKDDYGYAATECQLVCQWAFKLDVCSLSLALCF